MPDRVRWLALLPASKGVSDAAADPAWGELATGPAREVLDAIGDADDGEWPDPVSTRGTTAAWRRYDGVVHRAADPGSLEGGPRDRWRRHLRYVSALAGLLAPTDRIPAYRLEMATVTDDLGGLGPFWRPHVTAALDEALTASGTLWLLTGGEYARAVDVPDGRELVEPTFLRADGRTMPSATVKQARGQLARALVVHSRLATRPTDERWGEVELTCAGSPVRFVGAGQDGEPVWRAAG